MDSNSNSDDNFKQMSNDFDRDFSSVVPAIKGLSKNSLQRVLIKLLAYPFRSDDFALFQSEEEPVFQMATEIEQLKISMTLEGMGINTKELISNTKGEK